MPAQEVAIPITPIEAQPIVVDLDGTKPLVQTARFGRGAARMRRMQNWATQTPVQVANVSSQVEVRAVPALGVTTTLAPPTALGQQYFASIDTTTGGAWVIQCSSDMQLAGAWVSDITLTGAGAFIKMESTKYSGEFRWIVIGSNGAT